VVEQAKKLDSTSGNTLSTIQRAVAIIDASSNNALYQSMPFAKTIKKRVSRLGCWQPAPAFAKHFPKPAYLQLNRKYAPAHAGTQKDYRLPLRY
jgi:hypothetical protein